MLHPRRNNTTRATHTKFSGAGGWGKRHNNLSLKTRDHWDASRFIQTRWYFLVEKKERLKTGVDMSSVKQPSFTNQWEDWCELKKKDDKGDSIKSNRCRGCSIWHVGLTLSRWTIRNTKDFLCMCNFNLEIIICNHWTCLHIPSYYIISLWDLTMAWVKNLASKAVLMSLTKWPFILAVCWLFSRMFVAD